MNKATEFRMVDPYTSGVHRKIRDTGQDGPSSPKTPLRSFPGVEPGHSLPGRVRGILLDGTLLLSQTAVSRVTIVIGLL